MVPVRSSGVETLYRAIQVNRDSVLLAKPVAKFAGYELGRVALKFFEPKTIAVDFCSGIAVGRAGNTDPDRARSAVPWQADHAGIERKIFPTKLCSNTTLAGYFHDLLFHGKVSEALTQLVPGGRELVKIAG